MTNIHVAPYSKELIVPMAEEICRVLPVTESGIVFMLDPCAGTGWRLDEIVQYANRAVGDEWGGVCWYGVEIEPAYVAEAHPNVHLGDSTDLRTVLGFDDTDSSSGWDMAITSPTYGNGCNDNFKSKVISKRNTYIHRIRAARRGGKKRWAEYLRLNGLIYREMSRVLKYNAPFIVNTKDFWSSNQQIDVTLEHKNLLEKAGFEKVSARRVWTPGLREGENGDVREMAEWICTYRNMK